MNRNYRSIITTIGLAAFLIFAASSVLAAPGDLDLTFSGDGKLTDFLSRGDDAAQAVAIQPDGKIVVAGTSYGDFAVARYNIDGSLDSSFGTDGRVTTDINSSYDYANAIAIQQDGKIVVAGSSQSGYSVDFALVRYNADGSLDSSFGTGGKVTTDFASGSDIANSVAIQIDGKIVAAGQSQVSGGFDDFALARFNPDGSLDSSFDGDGKITTDIFNLGGDRAYEVAINANGKIVAAGEGYDRTSGRSFFTLVQYNLDGSLDTSFDGDGKAATQFGGALSVAIQTDGKIVAAGWGGSNGSGFFLVRYSSTGSIENVITIQLASPYFDVARSVAIQPDGKIVAAGPSYNGLTEIFAAVRLNANFSLDTTFGVIGRVRTTIGSSARASAVAVQTNGKIVAAGDSYSTDSYDFAVARYDANGTLDTSFDGDGKVTTDFGFFQGNALSDTAIQADGKIVAAGAVRGDFGVLRYNADGSPDASFGSGTGKVRTAMSTYDGARAVAIQADGKIVAAGTWNDNDGNECCFALARYNINGSLDSTFGTGGTVVTTGSFGFAMANDIAIQPDGKIVVAGAGYDAGTNGFAVYRYNSNGSLDTSFSGDGMVITQIGSFGTFASDIAIQPDGKIVAAGASWPGSGSAFHVVRYNGDGSLDTTFDGDGIVSTQTSQQDRVYSSAVQPDGKIIVAGSRLIINNDYDPTGFAIIRYNANGSLDTTFGSGGIVTTQVGLHSGATAIALRPDGRIVASGNSSDISNPGDFAVVRYNANGSLDTTFSGNGIAMADFDNSTDNAYGMALDNTGRAVVAGESAGRFAIARFRPDGASTPFDFDGDGRSDIAVFRPSERIWYLNRSTAGFTSVQFALSSDKITPADLDGDRKTDIAVFRDGTWWWLNSGNSTVNALNFGMAGDIPVPADYSGDGRDEIAIYRSGQWWAYDLSTGQTSVTNFGLASDKPVPADYDGDGRVDQAVYRNGQWHLNRSSQGYTVVSFGLATDKPTVGDYDGDGRADQAVYRDGTWYLLQSTQGFSAFPWGLSTDMPAPADYDGDGKTDSAVYRSGTWYLRQSTSGISIQQFGLSGDRPVESAYLPQ